MHIARVLLAVPVRLEAEVVRVALGNLVLPVVEVQAVLVRGPRRQALVHVGGGDLRQIKKTNTTGGWGGLPDNDGLHYEVGRANAKSKEAQEYKKRKKHVRNRVLANKPAPPADTWCVEGGPSFPFEFQTALAHVHKKS